MISKFRVQPGPLLGIDSIPHASGSTTETAGELLSTSMRLGLLTLQQHGREHDTLLAMRYTNHRAGLVEVLPIMLEKRATARGEELGDKSQGRTCG